MIIQIIYDKTTDTYCVSIRRKGIPRIPCKFDTEQQAVSYLLDYLEHLNTYLIRK